jgi:hypothetical protein
MRCRDPLIVRLVLARLEWCAAGLGRGRGGGVGEFAHARKPVLGKP